MKRSMFLILSFFAVNAFAQSLPDIQLDSINTYKSFLNKPQFKARPAYFLNNQLVAELLTYKGLVAKDIESVHVIKGDTVISSTKYTGKVYIKTKYNSLFKTAL